MSTHMKPALRPESLLGAWHAQVAVTAKHSPWLVREMLRRKRELLPKFTAYYRQLRVSRQFTQKEGTHMSEKFFITVARMSFSIIVALFIIRFRRKD